MKTEADDPSSDLVDRVSELLQQVLDLPLAAQGAALGELCTRNEDCAEALRQGYGCLQDLDLLQVSQTTSTGAEVGPIAAGLPRSLGPFRLLEFLGAGGMGAVYRAEDEELRRPVALKLVRSELLASARTRSRFQRESEALARLDHPGLCTVYRAGSTDGQPWIAMRLVRGATLASLLESRRAAQTGTPGTRTSSREEVQGTLAVFEKIARALSTAHQAGVVHRDIKPANIVLTSGDEPVVIDFGLVHLEGSDSHLTVSGDHIGTPAYMAPEQIAPAGREPDSRTDVYALGVTLYEALTLQSPYPGRSREELFHCIVRGERRRLRQLRRGLSVDLELVLEKALDPEPDRRYASMTEFADDLQRVRRHEPPAARRIGAALRLWRWCRRNPVAVTFVTLLGLGLGTSLLLVASRNAESRRRLAIAYANLAGQLIDEHPEHALDLALLGVDKAPGDPETLGMLQRALQEVPPHSSWPLPWPSEQRVRVGELLISPRGDAALILGSRANDAPTAPILWRRGAAPSLLPVEKGCFDAHWSADGSMFVTCSPYSAPQLWALHTEVELLDTLKVPDAAPGLRVPRARILPDGEHIVLACSDGIARILDRKTGSWTPLSPALCQSVDPTRRFMRGLGVSADGEHIALGDADGRIVLHETAKALVGQKGRLLVASNPDLPVRSLTLSRHGDLIQVYDGNSFHCVLLGSDGHELDRWGSYANPAVPVDMDPGQDRVLKLVNDREPQLWLRADRELAFEQALVGHTGMTHFGAFRTDGRRLLTVGGDGTARIWDTLHARPLSTMHVPDAELWTCGFLGAGDECLLVSDKAIHQLQLPQAVADLDVGTFADVYVQFLGKARPGWMITADNTTRITLHDPQGVTRDIPEPIALRAGLQLSPDGSWLVSTSRDVYSQTQARIYGPDLENPQEIPLKMAQPLPVFGPDSQLLLIDVGKMGEGGIEHLSLDGGGRWQVSGADVQEAFAAACKGAVAFAYHAPSSSLAVALPGTGVTLWRWNAVAPFLERVRLLSSDGNRVQHIAFSQNGQMLLLAGTDTVVRLVDRNGNQLAAKTGHVGGVVSIGFSPRDDKFLIAATGSGVTVHHIDGSLILPIRPRAGVVTVAAFMPEMPDGDRILFATSERRTRIVQVDPQRLVDLARGVVRPEMSDAYLRNYKARVGDDH